MHQKGLIGHSIWCFFDIMVLLTKFDPNSTFGSRSSGMMLNLHQIALKKCIIGTTEQGISMNANFMKKQIIFVFFIVSLVWEGVSHLDDIIAEITKKITLGLVNP